MSNRRHHLTYALSVVVVALLGYIFFLKEKTSINANKTVMAQEPAIGNATCDYKIVSQKGYEFIQPLLSAKQGSESSDFSSLKSKIINLVEDNKRLGYLSSASVYLYSLSEGKWLYVNPDEEYHPGSLIKVPMLMTFLKESESNPALLDRKQTFTGETGVPTQSFNSANSIKKGNSYTIRELLRYMVAFSDNSATKMLNGSVVVKDFIRTFTDINLPEPNVSDRNYAISAKRMSDFFVVLYYATYLNHENSEYAMKLLSESDFKEGMVKELPSTVKVAHKFGEWGDNRIGLHEMHESGVVYLNNKPYLLTIMTKGSASKELTSTLAGVSKLIYEDLSSAGATSSM